MRGVSISPEGIPANSSATGDWKIYKRLLRYILPMWPVFVVAIVGFTIGSATEAYFARLFGDVIEDLSDPEPTDWWFYPAVIAVVALVRAGGEFTGEYLLARISFRVVHTLRMALFEQLLTMPSSVFDHSARGHLVSRITFNVAQLRDTATDALKIVIQDGTKVIVMVAAMTLASWQLTLIFLAIAPLVGIIVAFASRRFRRISRRIQNSMGDVTHVAAEMVNGYRVVRTFGGEDYERDRFFRSSDYNRRQQLKMVATKAWSTNLIQVLVALSLALLIGLLFLPEVAGTMSPGDVVYFVGLAGIVARPMRRLSEVNARLQRGLAAAEDIFLQIDQEPEADNGQQSVGRAQGRIEFRHVSFSYVRGDRPVLRDVNLVIEPGQNVALVGRSGSGKSTLASLLPRFYEVSEGEIRLDGRSLDDYLLGDLRNQVGLVTQDVVLFNDTLERNIAYGSLADRSAGEIRSAVVRAHAEVFIDALPDGLKTLVGDNGLLLSGGQRQRVAIARALLKDAPILILDEATSALDTESEKHIQAALDEVMRGRTTLVIAHRLSTIENADLIVVLDEGRIVEQGSHRELLSAGGTYATLYESQFADPAARTAPLAPPTAPVVEIPAPHYVERTFNPLVTAWYNGSFWPRLLLPVAKLFEFLAARRRRRYLTGRQNRWRAPVPIIVVGNIHVGGTGKSPLVIWLAEWLSAQGWSPGIVARGYGGKAPRYPLTVTAGTSPREAGDEAPMLAARTGCPVAVGPDRVAAARQLVEDHAVDIVVSDDGLQHYALARDIEIVVLDGERGLGNGLCLPAGPLREPAARLDEVDLVISNGAATRLTATEHIMQLQGTALVDVLSNSPVEPSEHRPRRAHAVAGIGNPGRFQRTLASFGIDSDLRSFPDHHVFRTVDLLFDDDLPVIVTEKDALKIRLLDRAELPPALFYLQIDAELDAAAVAELTRVLKDHGIARNQPVERSAG